jgi:NAD(P)H-hydrate epimerase
MPKTATPIMLTPHHLAAWLPRRDDHYHKYNFGHVLVVGGSFGKTGAPILAALAAATAGAGLVTIATWQENYAELVARTPVHLMTTTIEKLMLVSSKYDFSSLAKFDAVVIGPGLGTNERAQNFIRQLAASQVAGKWVIDADAIKLWPSSFYPRPLVFTPHLGELQARLALFPKEEEVDGRPQELGLKFCRQFDLQDTQFLVLKSSQVLIFQQKELFACWDYPNSALAKAGSGDLLAGIMAALWALPTKDLAQMVALAVGAHGLMGQQTAQQVGAWGASALTLLEFLPPVWQHLAAPKSKIKKIARKKNKKK